MPFDTFESLKNFLGLALPSEVDPREVARWFYHSSCYSTMVGSQKYMWLTGQHLQRLFTSVENATAGTITRVVRYGTSWGEFRWHLIIHAF